MHCWPNPVVKPAAYTLLVTLLCGKFCIRLLVYVYTQIHSQQCLEVLKLTLELKDHQNK
jgi:hypothetical protein